MTHCCEVGWEWSSAHRLGQTRGTLTWCGRRKILTDVFHGDRDTAGYPPEKNLNQWAGKWENWGPLISSKTFLACSTGHCWVLIWFQVFMLCCRITGCLPFGFCSVEQERVSLFPNFYVKSFLLSGMEGTENSTWEISSTWEVHELNFFRSWWNCYVVPVLAALYSCTVLALEIVHRDGEEMEGSVFYLVLRNTLHCYSYKYFTCQWT